jgi:hypothetical protein
MDIRILHFIRILFVLNTMIFQEIVSVMKILFYDIIDYTTFETNKTLYEMKYV